MRAERLWQLALERSATARACAALIPLQTRLESADLGPFVLRRLLSRTPKHLRAGGPKPNPFLPWDTELEVGRVGGGHVLLLNKFPVQQGHLLVITRGWKPQSGWLELSDWQAVSEVSADTSGLWFFNSCAAAGASQPHRHLQLLPRYQQERACPMEPLLDSWLGSTPAVQTQRPGWCHALSVRHDPGDPEELAALYRGHCRLLDLGEPEQDPVPRAPYNLLFSDRWCLTVRRRREHAHGFSINALGFAGYLLATEQSDVTWLQRSGGWELLQQVAAPRLDSADQGFHG
ncbi:MAG: ATP adenylyltransferase [Cyanobacteria bacterium K_Offshore_0m_m2_072]|nr:ATP adenylyltransferase [Cyanobacteria bacterium K_Offshore_0m_m2_072]